MAKKFYFRYLAFMLIGVIMGASGVTYRIGREWDRIILDNAALIDEVERLAGELASREQALTLDRGVPVRSIEIEIDGDVDEHVKLEVEKESRDLLRHLLGEEVDLLNPILIENMLDRTLESGERKLTITPTRLFLGSKMVIRLRVTDGPVRVSD